MLTTEQIQRITRQVILGDTVTEKGKEVDKFVDNLKADLDRMDRDGVLPEIPKEWP